VAFANERIVLFNAPAIATSEIYRHPGMYNKDGSLAVEPQSAVISRKGWLTPETAFAADWDAAEIKDESDDDDDDPPKDVDKSTWSKAAQQEVSLDFLMPNNTQYGFRFMYNPPKVSFSLGIAQGVNPSYVYASTNGSSSVPLFPVGSQIQLELTINRVDDLALLQYVTSDGQAERIAEGRGANSRDGYAFPDGYRKWQVNALNQFLVAKTEDGNEFSKATTYNLGKNTQATVEHLRDIQRRGTMHDLEYLMRSMFGRTFVTSYRGTTADVGIATGQPLVLFLGKGMVYRVKTSSFNFTHKVFTKDMVPTLTDVFLTFDRIPDIVNWGATADGDNGNTTRSWITEAYLETDAVPLPDITF
jgi:hypothetical protein